MVLGLGACHHDEVGQTQQQKPTCEPVAFVAGEHVSDRYDLFRLYADGHLTQVTNDLSTFGPSVASDGSWLGAARAGPGDWTEPGGYSGSRIVVLRPDGSVEARLPQRIGWMDQSPSIAPSGDRLAFLRVDMTGSGVSQVVLANRDGKGLKALASGGYSGRPAWSPDGSAITVVDYDSVTAQSHLVTIDLKSGTSRRMSVGPVGSPVVSPDGTHVLLSDSGYETPAPIVEIDLTSSRQKTIDPPKGVNWTNATYADPAGSTFRVLRFDQTVELRPQRLEIVDRDGNVQSSTVLAVVPLDDGGNSRTLLSEFSSSACFVTDQ